MTGTPALQFERVAKTYGDGPTEVRALDGVDLEIGAAEFVAVMGPSGCGKSTLLHLAGALEDATSGVVRVHGRDLAAMSATEKAALRRTEVGFVFQRLNLVASLSAIENVALPLELRGVSPRQAAVEARDALVAVGLTAQLDRYPDHFSGGQQQRIAIARAIVGGRGILLADEPTGALDSQTADDVVELLASLPASQGTAVVLVTHEPRFASWADRVVFLRDGKVVDQTSVTPPAPRSSAEPISVEGQ
ncbi:MAG: ABC transporter ATP-binding protein [Ilumatobacteraceae bacterium]